MAGTPCIFLDWTKPLVHAVADHLLSRWPNMDFSGVLLVVSGGRAGRRIISILADLAQTRQLPMIPPAILTPGALPDHLIKPPLPPAGDLARKTAWARALHNCESQTAQLFPRLKPSDSLAAWHSAAGVMEQCHRELSAGALAFAHVAARAQKEISLGDQDRWQCLADLHAAYLDELASLGLCDIEDARLAATENHSAAAPGTIVLAGVVDLSAQTRRLLEPLHDQLDILVFAPPDLADSFDSLGCLKTPHWADRDIDLSAANLRFVQTPANQAEEIFATIAAIPGGVRSDDLTIGVPDESLVPHIESAAKNLGDIPVRFGAGRPLSQTRPCRLLAAIADYLQTGAFREFAHLIKHPDITSFLHAHRTRQQPPSPDWQSLLDEYAGKFLPDRLGPQHSSPSAWRAQPDSSDYRADLAWLFSQIATFLGLLRPADSATAPPRHWAPLILALLHQAYARQSWNQADPSERQIIQACRTLRQTLDEFRTLPAPAESSPLSEISAPEAIRTLLSLAGFTRIPPATLGHEIDMVGWLELLPDDAPHLIITSFNDGLVPESSRPHPFLTNSLRIALGLASDEDRRARDAYLLTALIASRPPNSVTLISGRLSSKGDPLLPSRLIFAADQRTVAQRILTAVNPKPSQRPPLAWRFSPGLRSGFTVGATILPHNSHPPLDHMRVTSFRDYLRSPQGFYLRHILKLDTIDQSTPRELDIRQCGQLVHTVMKSFADSPHRDSTSRQECLDFILGSFDNLVAGLFGTILPGVLKFQTELIKKRLARLSQWQADWAKDGWSIRHAEWSAPADPALLVDNRPMLLRGRIDRIDRHAATGQWAILDYKVSARKTPDQTHLRAGQWRDLQLPLYRHLARHIIGDAAPVLGYICVADHDADIGDALAEWDQQALLSADDAAHDVVRAVRNWQFDDVGDDPPTDGIFAHIFGQDLIDEDTADSPAEASA